MYQRLLDTKVEEAELTNAKLQAQLEQENRANEEESAQVARETGRLEKENQETRSRIAELGEKSGRQCPEALEEEIERLETQYTECKVRNSEDIY